jgi:hypothetical protein
MKAIEITEASVKGKKVEPGSYKTLYHLTDYIGFSHSINTNCLSTLRSDRICTTYDPVMNHVGGRDHYHFKFALNGTKCLNNFEAYEYKSYATYTDGSGSLDWNEREISLMTKKIEPLSSYVDAVIILISPFSRSFVQWMFYNIRKSDDSFFGGPERSTAPRGITSMRTVMNEWKKPILIGDDNTIRHMTDKEHAFMQDCFKLDYQNKNFNRALLALAKKWSLIGYFKEPLTVTTLVREKLRPAIITQLNKIMAMKPIDTIDMNKVKATVKAGITRMGYGKDVNRLMTAFEDAHMFHPVVEPAKWGTIFGWMVTDKSTDKIIKYVNDMKSELARKVEYYKTDEYHGMHYEAWTV